MTHDSWVTKEDIEENVPEVLATYQNTLENAANMSCIQDDDVISSVTAC